MTILFCLGTGTAALENSLADPGCFAGAVRHHGFVFGIVFAQFIVQGIKRYAVVDISRDDMNIQHKRLFVAVIRKWLFDLLKQLFRIPFCLSVYCLLLLLLQIGARLDMGTVHKNRFRVQTSFLCCCFQYPLENILYRSVIGPMFKW